HQHEQEPLGAHIMRQPAAAARVVNRVMAATSAAITTREHQSGLSWYCVQGNATDLLIRLRSSHHQEVVELRNLDAITVEANDVVAAVTSDIAEEPGIEVLAGPATRCSIGAEAA